MDAVDVEAVQVQMLTDFLLLHNRGHFLVASLILALFCIVHKVFAEKLCGDRLFYGSIVPVLIQRCFDCHKRWFAVKRAHAHVVGHFLVGNRLSVENVSPSLLFILLDSVIEGDGNNGTTEGFIFKIGISYLGFVLCVDLSELDGFKAIVKNTREGMRIGLAVLQRGQAFASVNGTAVKCYDTHEFIFFLFCRHR